MKAKDLVRTRSRASAKRRVAYSLAAGAAAATAGAAADADVVYSGLQDISIDSGNYQTVYVQDTFLPLSPYGDIELKNYVFNGVPYQGLFLPFAPGKVVGFRANSLTYASALSSGALIDSTTLVTGAGAAASLAYGSKNPNAQFNNVTNAYIGFAFPISSVNHFAWMRVDINNAAKTFVIHDWAYESQPGVAIHAGDGLAVAVPGDYDHNGIVNQDDYAVWKSSFGSTTSLDADGNGDGTVDAADFTIWRAHLSAGSAAVAQASTAVPEPATLGMFAAGAAGLVLLRRLRKGAFYAN